MTNTPQLPTNQACFDWTTNTISHADHWHLEVKCRNNDRQTCNLRCCCSFAQENQKTIYYADVITKELITKVSRDATLKYEERHGNASLLNVRNLLAEFYAPLIKEMAQKNKVPLFHWWRRHAKKCVTVVQAVIPWLKAPCVIKSLCGVLFVRFTNWFANGLLEAWLGG